MRIKIQLSSAVVLLIDYVKALALKEQLILSNGEAVDRAFEALSDDELAALDFAALNAAEPTLLKAFVRSPLPDDTSYITTLNLSTESLLKLQQCQIAVKKQLSLRRVKKSFAIKLVLIAYLLRKKGALSDCLR